MTDKVPEGYKYTRLSSGEVRLRWIGAGPEPANPPPAPKKSKRPSGKKKPLKK